MRHANTWCRGAGPGEQAETAGFFPIHFSQLWAATSRLMFWRRVTQTRVRAADNSAIGWREEEVQILWPNSCV